MWPSPRTGNIEADEAERVQARDSPPPPRLGGRVQRAWCGAAGAHAWRPRGSRAPAATATPRQGRSSRGPSLPVAQRHRPRADDDECGGPAAPQRRPAPSPTVSVQTRLVSASLASRPRASPLEPRLHRCAAAGEWTCGVVVAMAIRTQRRWTVNSIDRSTRHGTRREHDNISDPLRLASFVGDRCDLNPSV